MSLVHNTGNFPEALYPGLAALWGQKYEMHPTRYTEFCEVKSSKQNFEKVQQFTGFPLAALKSQGNDVSFEQMFQGYQQEFHHLTFGLGAAVTREMVEDDQYDVISNIPTLLAESFRQLEETVATNVLNNGFNSASQYAKADGLPMFSASHPPVDGGAVQSNQPTTAADLTMTSLEQGCIDVMKFQNDRGLRMNVEVKKLIVPPDLYFVANKILESQQVVGSADNDKNIVANMGIKPVSTAFLTDTDAWFLRTSVAMGILFYWRRKPTIERDNEFKSQNLNVMTTGRFSVDLVDWRAWYGSAGV